MIIECHLGCSDSDAFGAAKLPDVGEACLIASSPVIVALIFAFGEIRRT